MVTSALLQDRVSTLKYKPYRRIMTFPPRSPPCDRAVVAHRDILSEGYQEVLPTIIFHGDGDTTVHPRNGDRLLVHLSRGANGSSPRVMTRQGQVPGGYEYTRFTYRDTEVRDLVERWSVHGLGHAWSGGSYPGSYTDPRGPDASAEEVRFFEQAHKR